MQELGERADCIRVSPQLQRGEGAARTLAGTLGVAASAVSMEYDANSAIRARPLDLISVCQNSG